MTRALAFIALRLFELCLLVLYPFAPHCMIALMVCLDPIHEALRPRGFYAWEDMDLREAYPLVPYGDYWEDPS